MAVPQKQPPKTIPGRAILKRTKNAELDVEIMSEIVQDGVDGSIKVAATIFDPIGAIPDGKGGKNFYAAAPYRWEQKQRGGPKIVSKLTGPAEIKGTIKIQTLYNPKKTANSPSGYGRGTTPQDEKTGNTSLGFHESCHREDYLNFVKTKKLPTFGGTVGMNEQKYLQASQQFLQAMKKYFEDMDKYSFARTDEVGYKKSTYDLKGQRR